MKEELIYLKGKGVRCPRCSGVNIDSSASNLIDLEETIHIDEVYCNDCGDEFTAVFKIVQTQYWREKIKHGTNIG